jgi:hypothetical protein
MEPKKNLDWSKMLKYHIDTAHVRYTMPKSEIQSFVTELHRIQQEMLDISLEIQEKKGFPEANAIIKHIMELKQ